MSHHAFSWLSLDRWSSYFIQIFWLLFRSECCCPVEWTDVNPFRFKTTYFASIFLFEISRVFCSGVTRDVIYCFQGGNSFFFIVTVSITHHITISLFSRFSDSFSCLLGHKWFYLCRKFCLKNSYRIRFIWVWPYKRSITNKFCSILVFSQIHFKIKSRWWVTRASPLAGMSN